MERHILRAEVVIIDFFDPSNPTPDLQPLPGLVTLPHFPPCSSNQCPPRLRGTDTLPFHPVALSSWSCPVRGFLRGQTDRLKSSTMKP